MIERLHRHVHSQLSKYITSIRQRQVFCPLKTDFLLKILLSVLKKLNGYLRLLAIFIKKLFRILFCSFVCSFDE